MKNSASNLSIMQALQVQARELLPAMTRALSVLQYSDLVHQRIAQQNGTQTQGLGQQNVERDCYQGLTRAQHSPFGHVMIKWQLNHYGNYYPYDLIHEIDVLKSLHDLSQNQSGSTIIAPPVLTFHKTDMQVLGESQQLTILVMPYYLEGSLAKQLNKQRRALLTDTQKHHFIHQTAHLIANIHNAGWLHNDIKPSNILLNGASMMEGCDRSIKPKLLMTDFALAEKVDNPIQSDAAGTPAYLAPERWQGQSATVQSDIYAFGIMMVEILTGKRPFKISDQSCDPMIVWATQHCQQPVPRLPMEYSHYQFIVDAALAKRVEKRYKTMEEILLDLERV